jgi:hypothetical protein
MRWLLPFIFIFFGCSHQLKYKYSHSKRYLASLTSDEVVVDRIEISLKDSRLFASGIDSTFVHVQLYDKSGALLTTVDPSDLTLSTSVDLMAKPFTLKQGVYKAQILPKVKSQSIKMRVDWQEGRAVSPEITLVAVVKPLKDKLIPLHHDFVESKSSGEINIQRGSASPETASEGFSFDNIGDNRIIDSKRHKFSMRSFTFAYLEHARQNLAMEVDDAPNEIVSHTMHSIFMFFPRKQLPLVEQLTGTLNVTLPNGEKLIFQKDSKEIVDGVFLEGPLDGSSDRMKRKYPDLKYMGRGVVLRVNARGQSPQLGEFEKNKIDLEHGITGSADVLIINGTTDERCRRPKRDFWDSIDVNPIEFKFSTDEEFDVYLKKNCGFGLPKL